MAKRWTKTEAFAEFGAKCSNDRWSWSARSQDDNVVVLTFWQDFFDYTTRPPSYPNSRWRPTGDMNSLGRLERTENIKLALARHDGVVSVVVTIAKDSRGAQRDMAECFPHKRLKKRITDFDEATGDFRAEAVEMAGAPQKT